MYMCVYTGRHLDVDTHLVDKSMVSSFGCLGPYPFQHKTKRLSYVFLCCCHPLQIVRDSQSVGVSFSCLVSGAPSQFWRSFSQLPAQRQLMQTPPQKSSGLCWIEASGLNQCTKQTEFILKTTALYTTTALCKQIEISSRPPSSTRGVQTRS